MSTAATKARDVDASLVSLTAEASGIEVHRAEAAYPASKRVLPVVPSTATGHGLEASYYGLPVLKEPVWIWSIPTYFHVGGVAGATATLAAAAHAIAPRRMRRLVRAGRWIAASGCALGAGLLIFDLGRPARFLNMLRVFRPTSPMSVGSWTLAASGATAGAAALFARSRGALGRLGDGCGYAAGLLGLPLAGYTAVLLTNTAIPIWSASRRTLPPLFIASAIASAGAVLGVMPLRPAEALAVHRFGIVGNVAELVAAFALRRAVSAVEPVGEPLRSGASAVWFRAAVASSAAALVLSIAAGRNRRGFARGAHAVVATAAGLALRFAVLEAGKASARDPRATFRSQRAAEEAARERLPARQIGAAAAATASS